MLMDVCPHEIYIIYTRKDYIMDVKERVLTCRLIEQMNNNQEYTSRLGLHDASTYHGESVMNYRENGHSNEYSYNSENHIEKEKNYGKAKIVRF